MKSSERYVKMHNSTKEKYVSLTVAMLGFETNIMSSHPYIESVAVGKYVLSFQI